MILQALTQYYETLVQAGVLAGPGWGPVKASYAFRRSSSEGKRLCSPPRCSRSLLRSNAQ